MICYIAKLNLFSDKYLNKALLFRILTFGGQFNYKFKHQCNCANDIVHLKSGGEDISIVRDYLKIKREQKDADLEDAREIFKKYIK